MFNPTYVAFAIIAVVIFTIYMAMVHLIFFSSKLKHRVKIAAAGYSAENDDETPPALALMCESALKALKMPTTNKETAIWLSRAGLESPYAVTYYIFFSRIMQPIILLLGLYALLITFKSGGGLLDILTYLIVTVVFVLAGLRGAKMYVENLRTKRVQKLVDAFPEMLDLLLVCIESGLGLDAALNRVCKELRGMHPIVVSELDRVRLELTMLNDRSQALQNLSERVDVVAFKTLSAALIQTEKFGTSLVDTLRVLSEEQRLTRLYNAEAKAARIPVLITIPLILFIMPAFIMIIVGPPIVKVINNGGIFGGANIGAVKR